MLTIRRNRARNVEKKRESTRRLFEGRRCAGMTNDIIKALEHCGDENNCADCPFKNARFGYDVSCAEELMKAAAETLKNLKAENERLQSRIKSVEYSKECLLGCFKEAKAQAYREFVMLALRKIGFVEHSNVVVRRYINNAYEELTEHKETVSMIDGHIEE